MEKIIGDYLVELFTESDNLTKYMDEPAVFNTKAPDDMDEGWNDEIQYPRCIFELNMQANPERKVSGQLFIDVMCENDTNSVQPETLAETVKQAVDGCFFSKPELTISAQWNRSDNFGEKDNKLSGITLTFDILAYPKQGTEKPDPIHAANLWLKTVYQEAYVIGFDELPKTWKPTDENPALYTRLSKLGQSNRMKSTAAVTWLGADIQIHVMTPSEEKRAKISSDMMQLLFFADKLILDDGSPMLIDNVNTNFGADPQREGQINIKATYGVLYEYTGTPIKSIHTSGMDAESEVNDG